MKKKILIVLTGLALSLSYSALAQKYSAEELNRRTVERRAVEAAIWGISAVIGAAFQDRAQQAGTLVSRGRKEKNWTSTKPGGRFEAIFRLYGPEEPLFKKTWVLPDIEEVK